MSKNKATENAAENATEDATENASSSRSIDVARIEVLLLPSIKQALVIADGAGIQFVSLTIGEAILRELSSSSSK